MLSVDANILIYAVDYEAADKHRIAKQLLENAARTERIVLTEQSIFEFLTVSTRKRKRPLGEAVESIREWTSILPVIRPGGTILDEAVTLLERYRLSVWDARMIATCAMHACEFLLSEDMQDGALYGALYGAVRVINPFESRNNALVRALISA